MGKHYHTYTCKTSSPLKWYQLKTVATKASFLEKFLNGKWIYFCSRRWIYFWSLVPDFFFTSSCNLKLLITREVMSRLSHVKENAINLIPLLGADLKFIFDFHLDLMCRNIPLLLQEFSCRGMSSSEWALCTRHRWSNQAPYWGVPSHAAFLGSAFLLG